VEARLQRRVQRYGWDLAAADYDSAWSTQLAGCQEALLALAGLRPGERVLDVACGTGHGARAAALAVGPCGTVLGVDLSGAMVEAAQSRSQLALPGAAPVCFARMDGEALDLPDASFDVVLCVLGLMYMPQPAQALREMRRVLRPGGRLAAAVWGERARCGWADVFGIVDAEVASDVCPLFFQLGAAGILARECVAAGFASSTERRLPVSLAYADGAAACQAAFAGGPVALAWSRFDAEARARAQGRYLASIARWRGRDGYRVPAEFVLACAYAPPDPAL
jgi:ubiquinone/menaquinone biosynthesis C-methylase UbiE